jgi:hypothetical protein
LPFVVGRIIKLKNKNLCNMTKIVLNNWSYSLNSQTSTQNNKNCPPSHSLISFQFFLESWLLFCLLINVKIVHSISFHGKQAPIDFWLKQDCLPFRQIYIQSSTEVGILTQYLSKWWHGSLSITQVRKFS